MKKIDLTLSLIIALIVFVLIFVIARSTDIRTWPAIVLGMLVSLFILMVLYPPNKLDLVMNTPMPNMFYIFYNLIGIIIISIYIIDQAMHDTNNKEEVCSFGRNYRNQKSQVSSASAA